MMEELFEQMETKKALTCGQCCKEGVMKLRNNYFEHLYHITKGIYFKVQKRQNSGKGQVKIRQEAHYET